MRLTKKIKVLVGVSNKGIEDEREVIAINDKKLAEEKLFALEDIEDELGIDLVTLFNAIKEGVYVRGKKKPKYRILWFDDIDSGITDEDVGLYWFDIDGKRFYFKDYGKTWALTKEELE